MNTWLELIIAVLGGGGIVAAIQKLSLLHSDKRKSNAEAERMELENDNVRFEGYESTLNYLNERLTQALKRMGELEDALSKSNAEIVSLKQQLTQERANHKNMLTEIEDLSKINNFLRDENTELKKKLEELQ